MQKESLREAFEQEMKGYTHALIPSDDKINSMEMGEKIMYFEDAKKMITLRCYQQEWDETMRGLIDYLSLESANETERDGYRLAFVFLRKFKARMEKLALRAQDEQKKRALQKANNALS